VSNSREDGLTVLPPCPAAMVVGSWSSFPSAEYARLPQIPPPLRNENAIKSMQAIDCLPQQTKMP
jgi:hypothetical protein